MTLHTLLNALQLLVFWERNHAAHIEVRCLEMERSPGPSAKTVQVEVEHDAEMRLIAYAYRLHQTQITPAGGKTPLTNAIFLIKSFMPRGNSPGVTMKPTTYT